MEELKLHSEGVKAHLKSLKDAFKQNLKNRTDLPENEKEIQLAKSREAFLEEKKQLKDKLF